jgi:hypothetical protein
MWQMILGLFAVPLLLVEGGIVFDKATLTRWALVNCALYPLLSFVSIALHEGGHAWLPAPSASKSRGSSSAWDGGS